MVAWQSVNNDQAQYPRVWSIAHQNGTVNTTPLTSLVVARLLNRRPGRFDDRAVFQLQGKTEADVSAAQQQVVSYLLSRTTPVNAGSVGNFITTPLTAAPGDAHFDALVQLHNSLLDSERITGVEEHMLFGSDGPADLRAMLSLDFMANCTLSPTGTGPSGSTRIIVDRRAINFVGVLDLPFQSNDQLSVTAGMTSDNREPWSFSIGGGSFGGGHDVSLTVREGRLESVLVSTSAGGSQCLPQSEVLLAGKHPSLIALIRLLAQSVGNLPSVQCTSSGSFFTSGAHALNFDTQGGIRFDAPSGPALHLASFIITVNATLTVAGPEVQPIVLTSLSAARELDDNMDSFAIGFTPGGPITGVRLTRQIQQSIQSQTCGTI
jgi:hypothetical protein